jgi:ankyrin repeat protein
MPTNPNNTNKAIDALFILIQHQPAILAPDMLRLRATCRAFIAEEFFENIIAKQHFGEKKRTLFMYYVKSNKMNMVKYMLQNYKFDINFVANDHNSALCYACENNNVEMIHVLLNNGANVQNDPHDGSGDDYIDPAYYAIKNNNTDILKLLVERGAKINYTHHDSSYDLEEPLMMAVHHRNLEIVTMILKADTDLDNWKGTYPFYDACANGDHEIVQAFIDAGMEGDCLYDYETLRFDTEDAPEQTETALMVASTIEVVRILIENNADINAETANGRTALSINCEKGKIDIVRHLIDEGCDVNVIDNDGKTPLSIACEKKNKYLVYILVRNDADIIYNTAEGEINLSNIVTDDQIRKMLIDELQRRETAVLSDI